MLYDRRVMREALERLEREGLGEGQRRLVSLMPEEARAWCTPKTALLEGRADEKIVGYASENQIDMIVLGVRGHGLVETLFVGSTTDRVARQAPCPVLAVRPVS